MAGRALVVGGTGPTGPHVVAGLIERGFGVTILHRGHHEVAEIPPEVVHLHHDPFDRDDLERALDGLTFDVCLAMYGRLRVIADVTRGRVGRVVSVGGVPAYRGWMNPWAYEPPGLPVPVAEDAPTVDDPALDEKGYRIVRTEERLFELQPHAAHFRYPIVYGPYQPAPREWLVVRRILDGRPHLVLADDGLTLVHHGYVENLAHALLLAVDHPEVAAGKVFNVGDEEVLTIRQVVELICAELGHPMDLVSMPWELAVPARPLVGQPLPTHRVLDLTRLRSDLGYRDVVPARVAIGRVARWLAEHPRARGGIEEQVLSDPFDYAAEDRLIAGWKEAVASVADPGYAREPGWGLTYSGPGSRPRSQADFEA